MRARHALSARRPSAPVPFAFLSPWKTCWPRDYYTSRLAMREVTFSLQQPGRFSSLERTAVHLLDTLVTGQPHSPVASARLSSSPATAVAASLVVSVSAA